MCGTCSTGQASELAGNAVDPTGVGVNNLPAAETVPFPLKAPQKKSIHTHPDSSRNADGPSSAFDMEKQSDDCMRGGLEKGRVGGFIGGPHCSGCKGQIHFLLETEWTVTDSWNTVCWI